MCLISSQYKLPVVFDGVKLMNMAISHPILLIFLTKFGNFALFEDSGIISLMPQAMLNCSRICLQIKVMFLTFY